MTTLSLLLATSLLSSPTLAASNPNPLPIGFSRFVLRDETSVEVYVSTSSLNETIQEEMTRLGLKVVDDKEAVLQLGGVIDESRCRMLSTSGDDKIAAGCTARVTWKLLHVPTNTVVYTGTVDGMTPRTGPANEVFQAAVVGSLEHVVLRRPFADRLDAAFYGAEALAGTPAWGACSSGPTALPEQGKELRRALLMAGDGGGAIVDEEGHALVMAHGLVVGSTLNVTLNEGLSLPADVLAVDAPSGLALLKVAARGLACVPQGSVAAEQPLFTATYKALPRPAGLQPGDAELRLSASPGLGTAVLDAQGGLVGLAAGDGAVLPLATAATRLGLSVADTSVTSDWIAVEEATGDLSVPGAAMGGVSPGTIARPVAAGCFVVSGINVILMGAGLSATGVLVVSEGEVGMGLTVLGLGLGTAGGGIGLIRLAGRVAKGGRKEDDHRVSVGVDVLPGRIGVSGRF